MPYPTGWFPHSKSVQGPLLTNMAWRALHCVCEHDGLSNNDLAHKLSISNRAAAGLVRSLRKKGMLKKSDESKTLAITQAADRHIFQGYE